MARWIVVSLAVALLAAVAPACGGDEEATTSAAGPVPLAPCPPSSGPPDGSDWGAKVSGISCRDAGKLIQYRILKCPRGRGGTGGASAPCLGPDLPGPGGERHVAGYACKYREYANQRGYYHVSCENGAERFTWNFTP